MVGRFGLRVMTGLALAATAILIITMTWASEKDPAHLDRGPGDVVRIGVVEGQSVPGYLASSRGELNSLLNASPASPTWALVSLSAYVAPDRLTSVLGGAAVALVYAKAPLKDTRTQVVRIPAYRLPDDVVTGMLATAQRRDREEADYHRLSRDLTGAGPSVIRLRRAYESAASAAAAEAHAYRAHCACVFAAVVRAVPAALRDLAGRAGVRAVDPAPEVRDLDRVEFRPPLPEMSRSDPTRTATASAPAGISSVAPETLTPLTSSSGTFVTSDSPDDPGAGSGPPSPASEERSAVPSAPAPAPPSHRSVCGRAASCGASGR
jgi:hypothetical protein